nr:DUF892 family protein [Rhizobium leguminosarum]
MIDSPRMLKRWGRCRYEVRLDGPYNSRRRNPEDLFRELRCENFEVAAYKSLLTIAEAGGHGAATGALEANLAEEKATARWLDENIVSVTTKFLSSRSWRESQGLWEQRSSRVVNYQRIGPASLGVGLSSSIADRPLFLGRKETALRQRSADASRRGTIITTRRLPPRKPMPQEV